MPIAYMDMDCQPQFGAGFQKGGGGMVLLPDALQFVPMGVIRPLFKVDWLITA